MEKMAAVQTLIVFVGYCGILRAVPSVIGFFS